MRIMIPFMCVLFMGGTRVSSVPSLMSNAETRTACGAGCYQMKQVPCEGGEQNGCEAMECTWIPPRGHTIPGRHACQPTGTQKEVTQDPYETAVPATVGVTGQDDHNVPDPDNPTDPSNYYACVKKYTCSNCESRMVLEPVSALPPYIIYVWVEKHFCDSGPAHDQDTYDPELQQLQVLTGESCTVPGPGTTVDPPIDP